MMASLSIGPFAVSSTVIFSVVLSCSARTSRSGWSGAPPNVSVESALMSKRRPYRSIAAAMDGDLAEHLRLLAHRRRESRATGRARGWRPSRDPELAGRVHPQAEAGGRARRRRSARGLLLQRLQLRRLRAVRAARPRPSARRRAARQSAAGPCGWCRAARRAPRRCRRPAGCRAAPRARAPAPSATRPPAAGPACRAEGDPASRPPRPRSRLSGALRAAVTRACPAPFAAVSSSSTTPLSSPWAVRWICLVLAEVRHRQQAVLPFEPAAEARRAQRASHGHRRRQQPRHRAQLAGRHAGQARAARTAARPAARRAAPVESPGRASPPDSRGPPSARPSRAACRRSADASRASSFASRSA